MSQTIPPCSETDAQYRELIVARNLPNEAASIGAFNSLERRLYVVDVRADQTASWANELSRRRLSVGEGAIILFTLIPDPDEGNIQIIDRQDFYKQILPDLSRLTIEGAENTKSSLLNKRARLAAKKRRKS